MKLLKPRPLLVVVDEELYHVERELIRADANLAHWAGIVASLNQRKKALLSRKAEICDHTPSPDSRIR